MERNQAFAVLGGDARQFSLIAHLAATGAEVRVFGLPSQAPLAGVTLFDDWREAVVGSGVIVLPLPASPDGVRVNCPLLPDVPPVMLSELFKQAPPDAVFVGGRFSPAVKDMAEREGRELLDYCKCEGFLLKNAVPTAEGAVSILMDRLPRTVSGMSVAVTGYGRVARALCELLVAMGAQVTVGARKKEALLEAAKAGCRTLLLCGDDSVVQLCRGKHAVFNTVPHWIFSREVLSSISPDLLLVDLASAPGGVDGEAARALGVPVIWALSLPGKYAPVSAGEIIADTVLSLIGKENDP